jgi:hypothetical protein
VPAGERLDVGVVVDTMWQHVQTDLEAGRQTANTLAALIIGGSWHPCRSEMRQPTKMGTRTRWADQNPVGKSVYKRYAEGPSRSRKGPLTW